MKYNEYMESLLEQIQDNRAKILVREEIKNHIEEQCEAYECEGISHKKALEESIRQMGNPVDVGIELNKIHRPKVPIKIILIAIGIMLIGIISQVAININTPFYCSFFVSDIIGYSGWLNPYIADIIINFLLAIIFMLLIVRIDYTFFGRYPYSIFAWYIYAYIVLLVAIESGLAVETICHMLCLCYPLILSGIIYANRNKGNKGLLTCIISTCLVGMINWWIFEEKFIIIETMIISVIVIFIGIIKNIFGRKKRNQVFCLCSICLVLIVGMTTATSKDVINLYKAEAHFCECMGIRKSTADKILITQRDRLKEYKLFGKANLEDISEYKDDVVNIYQEELILSGVFENFGIVAGIFIILFWGFLIYVIFRLALRQSNRIGMLLGIACGVSLLIRIVACILMNLGLGVFYTTVFPILGYGLLNNISTGIFMGIIICIARNSSILCESNSDKKEKWIKNYQKFS